MAAVWIAVCTVKKTAWNILDTALTELTALRITAGAALDKAKNDSTRTPVTNA
jgi:hypothetical protein